MNEKVKCETLVIRAKSVMIDNDFMHPTGKLAVYSIGGGTN
jgi:hypothetical protein